MKNSRILRKLFSLLLALVIAFSVAAVGIVPASAAQTNAVTAEDQTKTYYFSSGGNWSNLFCVYAWTQGNKEAGVWKQLTKVASEDDLYYVELSSAYTHVIFASRTIPAYTWDAVDNKTEELLIPDGCNYLTLTGDTSAMWGYYVADEGMEVPDSTQQIFFAPDEEWIQIQSSVYHEFAVRAWSDDDTDGYWAQFELVEGSYGTEGSVWKTEIPASYKYVEFCRIEGTVESGVWNIWEKTDEQTIPASSNLFTQNADIETGTWSYYEAPETEPTEEPSESESTGEGSSEEPVIPVETKTVYFTANEDWLFYTSDMASVSVYTWSDDESEGTWTWAEAVENKDGLFVAEVPEDALYIFFGLCYGASPDVVWAQTDNQTIPDDGNHFTQDEAGNSGSWSLYTGNDPAPAGKYYSVVFVNYDNTLLKAQVVAEGGAAVAPVTPSRISDAQYTYTFAGWDTAFTKVTSDIIVKATYTTALNEYTVTFVGKDDSILFAQTVPYGNPAEAPEAPEVEGYTFTGWDKDFDNITESITVKALYKKLSSGVGTLEIQVAGGTGFRISVNDGNFRPQGTSYINKKMPTGASVTVVANASADVEFLGWANQSGAFLSTSDTYSFVTSGNDYIKAVYKTIVEDVNVVIFKNAKAASGNGQILDMQYYAAGDTVEYPDAPAQAGYTFTGWSLTAEGIQNKLAAGQDVIVTANWEIAKVYISVTVNGGKINTAAQSNGMYIAYAKLSITANSAPSGQKFAYWADEAGRVMSYDATYESFPVTNVNLTAVYVAESTDVTRKPLVNIEANPTTEGEKITYTISWDVDPSVGKITNYGLVVVDKNDYDEETFYHGSGDSKLFDRAVSTSKAKNTTSIALSGRAYDHTYKAIAFVIYTDAKTGASITIYSDMTETYKQAP